MSLPQMSFSGAVMILIIVVIRALALHKLPKKTFLVLWGVVLVRLLVPYSVPSVFSVYSLVGRLTPTTDETKLIPVSSAVPVLPPQSVASGTTAFAPKPSVPALDPWVVIWLIGVLGCTIFFGTAYFKCRGEFRTSLPVGSDYAKRWLQVHRLRRPVTIRQSDRISAPLTYGIIRPVILMPKSTDWSDEETLAYVLGHEYVHIRRFDAVAKLALTSALCIHWFNPLVWIMYVLANRDIELSCDEAVIRGFGERTKSAYAMTLIRMEETRSGFLPLCNNFSKNAIEERIVAIMKIKKPSLVTLIISICLIAGVIATFATSAQAVAENDSADIVQTAADDSTVILYTDPADGKTHCSRDGGKTWMPLSQEELNAASSWNNVEWWTAEEYAAWLEQEKTALQSIIDRYEQERLALEADIAEMEARYHEAIARYKQTPKDVQAGQTADCDTTVISYTDPTDGKTYYSRDGGKTWMPLSQEELNAASSWNNVEWWTEEEYAAWLEQEKAALQSIIGEKGWNPTDGWYTWTQDLVDEAIARYEQTLKDIQAGKKISKPTSDGDTMIQFGYAPTLQMSSADTAAVFGSVAMMDSVPGETVVSGNGQALTPELLKEYKANGLTYDGAKEAFYFNGKLVRYFFDGYTLENGVATIYDHVNKDGIVDVHTIRQATQNTDGSTDAGGKLVGIEAYSQEEFDSRFIMPQEVTQETASTGFVGSTGGVTFEERFARYKDYGITYVEAKNASGQGNVYLNGQLVSRFSDVSPEGSAFSFTSADKGGIAVRTVYDSNGQLIGVEMI